MFHLVSHSFAFFTGRGVLFVCGGLVCFVFVVWFFQ